MTVNSGTHYLIKRNSITKKEADMAKKCIRGFSTLVLGIAVIALSGCTTCGTPYRKTLTDDHRLSEANTSYKKAINWLNKGECAATPFQAKESYTTAGSYLSDTIFKLKEQGHENNIDVTDELYYCEKMKRETDVKIGAADRK